MVVVVVADDYDDGRFRHLFIDHTDTMTMMPDMRKNMSPRVTHGIACSNKP